MPVRITTMVIPRNVVAEAGAKHPKRIDEVVRVRRNRMLMSKSWNQPAMGTMMIIDMLANKSVAVDEPVPEVVTDWWIIRITTTKNLERSETRNQDATNTRIDALP